MRELVFQVEFLSDIVLQASSNTEGNIELLDFIPGSNFLGMVAYEYDKFENSFDIFHNGKVRFGDANIVCDDKQTYKMPLSFFHEKKDKDKTQISNHHLIEDFSIYEQLKQIRNGYITKDLDIAYIDYNYSQKSAYDKENRKSKDSQMYGYSAIKQGTTWQFTLKYGDISEKELERIKKNLIGIKRLGKSKSAQYGKVEITQKGTQVSVSQNNNSSQTILYANSRISLVDKEGNPTYDLKYLCDGLEDKNIVYEKTQLRKSSFTPYNGARQTKDYERVCINKGSVLVLKDLTKGQLDSLENGVGVYLSEGFGDVILNPSFLFQKEFGLKKSDKKKDEESKQEIKSTLSQFLNKKENLKIEKLKILNEVDAFIDKNRTLYKNIKSSQWGKIRSICTSGEDKYKEEIREYLSHGVKKWEDKQIDTLLQDEYSLEFIQLISIQLPKVVKNGN
ncbi:MAG: hypothetical protein U9P38_06555 [Campylobacterota bacterium]|nr:hypothetical protein [Campylobacterota bacterium]